MTRERQLGEVTGVGEKVEKFHPLLIAEANV